MPFQGHAFRALTPEEASPFGNIIQNMMRDYQNAVKSAYIKPSLAEELKKAQLYNKYYGPNIESEIGLRGAQAGHLGAETRGLDITNKYLEPKLQAELLQQAVQRKLQEEALGYLNQRNQPPTSNAPIQDNMPQGQGALTLEAIAKQTPVAQPQNPMDFTKAAFLSNFLKLGAPHYVTEDGITRAITPFGTFDVAKGNTTFQKELQKIRAKQVGELETTNTNVQNQLDNLNELNKTLGSPEFEAIRNLPAAGNLEAWVTGKFGTHEQQELVGRAKTLMGNVIKASARDFPGQFRVGEQALLNDMKPNMSDSLDVMKGKAAALTFITQMISQRSQLEAEYMARGMSAIEARKQADKEINPDNIKKQINTILHPARSRPTKEQALAELQKRRGG